MSDDLRPVLEFKVHFLDDDVGKGIMAVSIQRISSGAILGINSSSTKNPAFHLSSFGWPLQDCQGPWAAFSRASI